MKKLLLISALTMGLNLFAFKGNLQAEPHYGEIVWNELATANVQGAKDFYGKLFGWEFVDKNNAKKDMGDMTYTLIKKGEKDLGGIWAIPAPLQNQIPPHWLAYVLVDNIEGSLEQVSKLGGTLVKPVQKVEGMGHFAVIKDPTGAHIALWQPIKP